MTRNVILPVVYRVFMIFSVGHSRCSILVYFKLRRISWDLLGKCELPILVSRSLYQFTDIRINVKKNKINLVISTDPAEGTEPPGSRLNIMTVFPCMGIPVLKIRQSQDRIIFNMGIPTLVRRHFHIKKAPWLRVLWRQCDDNVRIMCIHIYYKLFSISKNNDAMCPLHLSKSPLFGFAIWTYFAKQQVRASDNVGQIFTGSHS